jgi:hypothetical protein
MDDKDAIHHHHHLQTYFDEDGMLVVRGRLSPEVGDLLRKALDAAMEELYKQPHEEGGTYVSAETSRRIGCESGKMVMTHAGDSSSRTPSPLSSA